MNERTHEADRLEAALLDSAAGRALSAAAGILRRAWASSATRRVSTSALERWSALAPGVRIRAVAIAIASAMITDRAAQLLSGRPADPLSASVPVVVLAIAIVAAVCSEALARVYARVRR